MATATVTPKVQSPDLAQPPSALMQMLGMSPDDTARQNLDQMSAGGGATVEPGSTTDLESRLPSTLALGAQSRQEDQATQDTANAPKPPGLLSKIGQGFEGALLGKNDTPASRTGAAIGRLFSGLAGAEGLAQGSTPVKQNIIEQNKIAAEMPLRIEQLRLMDQYHQGQLKNAQAGTAIKQQAADTREEGVQQTGDLGQQKQNTAEDLANARIPALQVHSDKEQAELQLIQQGQIPLDQDLANAINRPDLVGKSVSIPLFKTALAARGNKDLDLGLDGYWVVDRNGNKVHQISAISPTLARANSYLQRTQLPVNDAQGNILGWVNPQTQTFTSVSDIAGRNGAPSPSQLLGGGAIPPKPTSTVLTMGQTAQILRPEMDRIKTEVQDVAGKLGPGAGRWNDFWVNKGGLNDPDFAKVNQDLSLLATGIGRMHFGASIPQGFVQELMKQFGEAQSPEDLQARIDAADAWAHGYASSVGGGSKATSFRNPTAKTPSGNPPATPNSSLTVQEGATATGPNGHKIKFSGGRWADAATNQPIQ